MNQRKSSQEASANEGLLIEIERAISEKMQVGHSDEARWGFAAELANATPPVDASFQRSLRLRLQTVSASQNMESTESAPSPHLSSPAGLIGYLTRLKLGRLSLIGIAAAAMLLLVVMAVAQYVYQQQREPGIQAPTSISVPELDPAQVNALANQLNQGSARTVVVYPADYATTLAAQIRHRVVPLILDGGQGKDPGPETISAVLASILPASGLVDVIMVAQEATDASSQVRIALEQHLYRLDDEDIYGPLAWSRFLVGPGNPALQPMGAVFEGGIELVAAGVLDEPEPGQPLRLAFDWRSMEPVEDAPAMFAHLAFQGTPISQRDAVPGNGLFPVNTWQPGEVVRDQFALQLPPDLAPGSYELRVGIYDPATQMRYSLVEPAGGTFVVVERLTIKKVLP